MHVEKFSTENFFGNGLKLMFAILWYAPEEDLDLRGRELPFFRGEPFSAQPLLRWYLTTELSRVFLSVFEQFQIQNQFWCEGKH